MLFIIYFQNEKSNLIKCWSCFTGLHRLWFLLQSPYFILHSVSFDNAVLQVHHIYYSNHFFKKMIQIFNKRAIFKDTEIWQFSKFFQRNIEKKGIKILLWVEVLLDVVQSPWYVCDLSLVFDCTAGISCLRTKEYHSKNKTFL